MDLAVMKLHRHDEKTTRLMPSAPVRKTLHEKFRNENRKPKIWKTTDATPSQTTTKTSVTDVSHAHLQAHACLADDESPTYW